MPISLSCLAVLTAAIGGAPAASPEGTVLLVRDAPAGGIVLAPVRFEQAMARRGGTATGARAQLAGRAVKAQLVEPPHPDNRDWLIALRLPGPGDHRVELEFAPAADRAPPTGPVSVRTRWATVTHEAGKLGALPGRIEWPATKKVFSGFAWQDRAHSRKLGSFGLRYDAEAKIESVQRGEVCTVVRTRARYVRAGDKGDRPASRPEAIYQWVYFHHLPLVFVRAYISQESGFAWDELHFFELNYPDKSFEQFAGGEPLRTGRFTVTNKSTSFGDWAMLRDGRSAVAVLRSGRSILYDGRGGYGTYLHARATQAWQGWAEKTREVSAWLWLGSADDPVAEVQKATAALPSDARIITTNTETRRKIEAARKRAAATRDRMERRRQLHQVAMAEKLEASGAGWQGGDLDLWLAGRRPAGWATLMAGDLALSVRRVEDGLRCISLFDLARSVELASADAAPLLEITLKHARTGRTVQLTSDASWGRVDVKENGKGLELLWAKPGGDAPPGLVAKARCVADSARSRLSWTLEVDPGGADWGVWRVKFPQIGTGRFGRDVRVLVPQAAGVVKRDIWRKPFRYNGHYSSGWTSMQYMAAYEADGRTGLYVAVHDPNASTKDLLAATDTQRGRVTLAFDHPAENMGVGGAGFKLSGRAVWQLLRGDWFDASMIYRRWVRREAKWWPKLTADGRADTPKWMRELCVWGLLGGGAKGAVPAGRRFAEAMSLPAGFHWYNWHQIPFDNDYPHYFPPKEGFQQAVAELQTKSKRPIYVMPYINGRLWDTRDKGAADFEFGRLARAAATKDEKGDVRTETYGSKESDGSKVVLAAMCPSTKLWRDRVKSIVLRLMRQYGVKAVYIDQIAAARPRLCFDKAHGHPLGGGSWWVAAYGKMLEELRAEMPDGHMLTTECNAEPYLRWFDGYLTWHWQYDGQVPAFAAVYGGAIQMFGRAYRGGPTRRLALRMKAGQQLVYGEQIGWIDAGAVKQADDAAFLRQMAALRHRLRRYFHAGQMARPPKLRAAAAEKGTGYFSGSEAGAPRSEPGKAGAPRSGPRKAGAPRSGPEKGTGTSASLRSQSPFPTVTADWQWSGVWPVTTDAVLTGAWERPGEKKLVLIFVNVSGKPVTAELPFDAAAYGLDAEKVRLVTHTAEAAGKAETAPAKFTRRITFAPNKAVAWEIEPPASSSAATGGKQAWPAFSGKKSAWKGHDRYDFAHDGRKCIVVTPKSPSASRPWIWRARFFGHQPQADLALLAKGFHLAYMDVAGLFGSPKAVAHWGAFHKLLTTKHGLSSRPALEGMSRGGLIIFNWAAANPTKVACIYADAPVCDFVSWPGGRGAGKGAASAWRACLEAYGLTEKQALAYEKNPIDNLAPLAKARVPLLHVVGADDKVVPVAENTTIVEMRYKELGGSIRVISKPACGHHPHSLEDPAPIVEFILKHAGRAKGT